jgi:hypothetical protein
MLRKVKKMNQALQNIQYVSDAQGKAISVIVPIGLWQANNVSRSCKW